MTGVRSSSEDKIEETAQSAAALCPRLHDPTTLLQLQVILPRRNQRYFLGSFSLSCDCTVQWSWRHGIVHLLRSQRGHPVIVFNTFLHSDWHNRCGYMCSIIWDNCLVHYHDCTCIDWIEELIGDWWISRWTTRGAGLRIIGCFDRDKLCTVPYNYHPFLCEMTGKMTCI
jgi:hypothetical protein